MTDFPLIGTCDRCGNEKFMLQKYKGHYWCKFCIIEDKENIIAKSNNNTKRATDKVWRRAIG